MTESTRRRPVRGLLWGLILGLGLALIAIGQGWAALGTWPPFLLVLLGIVLGVAWSTVGPARGGPATGLGGDEEPAAPAA